MSHGSREAPEDPYDRIPYTDHAYAEAHPDRLAVVARLSGWSAPDVARARVLEIGCGRGGHLLPMAAALPDAALFGVDRSARQIDEARKIAEVTGLANVTWVHAGFEDAALDASSFDYVICHGVYSWIPIASRGALLDGIARWLSPNGVAYVSFNALPGWYERLGARDWLRFAAGRGQDAEATRASLAWLARQVSTERADYRRGLESVARRLAETSDAYLAHEYLADEHHPALVGEVLSEAADLGLAYLGDAIPQTTAIELLPPDAAARAEVLSARDAEQLVDFVNGASFRRALFVRADTASARAFARPRRLDPAAIASLRIASRLRPPAASTPDAGVELFEGPDASVQVEDPAARRALRELARAAPRSLAFDELADRARGGPTLARELFDLWLATGAIDLHAFEPVLADRVSPRPRACAVARWHAVNGGAITSRWHHEVVLPDPAVRRVLALADGSRTTEEMASALSGDQASLRGETAAVVAASLEILAASGLLVA